MSEETKKPKAPKKAKKPSVKNYTFTLLDTRHVTPNTNYQMTHKGSKDSLAKSIEKFVKGHGQQCVRNLNSDTLVSAVTSGGEFSQRVGKRTFTYNLKED